ncbi:hypothetical protein [Ktedonospora formicarum]|uniref:Uncharacterized protein n=1 Tax=Ktedonospora formicarum TaxID=2778364 RepID=A0A8J3I1L8_9CHLR|nr:hypothetical protein [Ktedonospora formicarum]GHO45931.1 hypothetical protein KSX_40940 [Ktedonospora formicarum]
MFRFINLLLNGQPLPRILIGLLFLIIGFVGLYVAMMQGRSDGWILASLGIVLGCILLFLGIKSLSNKGNRARY